MIKDYYSVTMLLSTYSQMRYVINSALEGVSWKGAIIAESGLAFQRE